MTPTGDITPAGDKAWDIDELTITLAHEAVRQVDSNQLSYLSTLAPHYLAAAHRAGTDRTRGRPRQLEFGTGAVEGVLLGAAVYAALAVADRLLERFADAALDHTGGWLQRKLPRRLRSRRWLPWRRRARRATTVPTIPPLSPDQLAQLHEIAAEHSRAAGLSEQRASLVADAIVGRLAGLRGGR